MAGQPKSRARKRQQQQGENGERREPPAAAEETAPRARAPAGGSRARSGPQRQPNWLDVGPEVRHAVDEQRAEQVRAFAGAMGQSGAEVQIERTRPTWCAGYLESRDVGRGGWRELLEYVRDEYGGERYRLALVTPNGTELAHVNQAIAGPPRERGRPINRERYERLARGETEPQPQPAPQPAPQPQPAQPDQSLLRLVLEQQEKAAQHTLEAVRDMVAHTKGHTEQLLGQILKPQQGSLGEQLQALQRDIGQVEKIREQLTPEPEPAPEPEGGPDLTEQREQMRNSFIEKAILEKFLGGAAGGGQQPQQPKPPPPHPRRQPQPQAAPSNGKRPPRAVEE